MSRPLSVSSSTGKTIAIMLKKMLATLKNEAHENYNLSPDKFPWRNLIVLYSAIKFRIYKCYSSIMHDKYMYWNQRSLYNLCFVSMQSFFEKKTWHRKRCFYLYKCHSQHFLFGYQHESNMTAEQFILLPRGGYCVEFKGKQ